MRTNSVPVEVGEKVRRYANLGLTGETGNACGEHLHYQVQPDGCAPSVDFCGNSVPSSFVDDTVPSNGVPTVIPSPTLTARNHPPDRLLRRDGNRKTEVLKTTGVQWQVTFSGQGAWSTVGSSPDVVSGITLGDFNNDGKTDAFKTVGSTGNCAGLGPGWKVSYSRPNNPPDAVDTFGIWGHLNCSSAGMSTLAFGDFDGDGKMDVFTTVWLIEPSDEDDTIIRYEVGSGKRTILYRSPPWRQSDGSFAPNLGGFVQLSPDQSTLVFRRYPADRVPEIYTISSSGGRATMLLREARTRGVESWSPDGKYVMVSLGRGATGPPQSLLLIDPRTKDRVDFDETGAPFERFLAWITL